MNWNKENKRETIIRRHVFSGILDLDWHSFSKFLNIYTTNFMAYPYQKTDFSPLSSFEYISVHSPLSRVAANPPPESYAYFNYCQILSSHWWMHTNHSTPLLFQFPQNFNLWILKLLVTQRILLWILIDSSLLRSYLWKVIAEIGFVPAFIFMADVFNEMEVSGNINLEFGGEMTGAIRQAKCVHECQLLLGDRPISLTIMRRASAMSWWTKIRLIAQVSLGLAYKPLRTVLLSNAHKVAESDPMTQYIFVFERDLCLVNALQMAAAVDKDGRFSKIVAVVGGGHIRGIHEYWGKMGPHIAKLIYEPTFNFKYC